MCGSTSFNVGDRVRVAETYPADQWHGRVGTITFIDDMVYPVQVALDPVGPETGQFKLEELELVA
jgi:hypothetical protein